MAKVLDCDIIVRFNSSPIFIFKSIPLLPTSSPAMGYVLSTRMALALNNPQRLICH